MITAGVSLQQHRRRTGDLAVEAGGKSLRFCNADRPWRVERRTVGCKGLEVDLVALGIHRRQHGAMRRLVALG